MNEIEAIIKKNRNIFIDTIWPKWRRQLEVGHNEIISTEQSGFLLEKSADYSGVDAFYIHSCGSVLIPIASRIESYETYKGKKPSPRFTIRMANAIPTKIAEFKKNLKKGETAWDKLRGRKARDNKVLWRTETECKKKIEAFNNEIAKQYLPYFTIQSMIMNDDDLKWSVKIKTHDLLQYIIDKKLTDPFSEKVYMSSNYDRYLSISCDDLPESMVQRL